MLNYLWAGMIIVGVIFAAFTGKMPDVTNAALDSSREAVTLWITMMGVMSFWVGIMEIAKRAGFDYLIGTLHNEKTGAIIGENCRGEEKVRRLNEEFKDYKIVDVYSDSYKHDKYIFSLAEGSCYHIEKGKRVEFKYKEKYGE